MPLGRIASVVLCAVVLAAGDWPRFRGPNGSGVGEGGKYPVTFSPSSNVIWRTPLPEGLSSPVIAKGRIFLTGSEGQRLIAMALDAASGRVLWQRHIGRARSEKLHKLNHAAAPSCVADGQTVVAFFPDFGLVAYSHEGAELWRVPLGPFTNTYGMGASPVVTGGKVILVVDQSRDSYIAAFDLRTGREVWKTSRPEAVSGHSTPIVHGEHVIAPGSFRMDAYEVNSGRLAWWAEGLPSEMKSVPVIAGGLVYIHGFNTPENDPGRLIKVTSWKDALAAGDSNADGRLSKSETGAGHAATYFSVWDLNSDGALDAAEWSQYQRTMTAENALLAFEVPERDGPARLRWKFQRSIPQLPSPLVYQGVVYLINESGVLTTLDATSGNLLQQTRLRGVADRYYASPVAAGGNVYVASHTGVVSVLEGGAEPRLLAANDLEEEILATPALVDSRVYVRTRTALWCFGGPRD